MNLPNRAPLHRRQGFTWIEVLVVVFVLVVLLVSLFPVNSSGNRASGSRIKCMNNLKNLGLAVRISVTDDGRFPWQVPIAKGGSLEELGDTNRIWRHFQVLTNNLSTPRDLQCPTDSRIPVELRDRLVFSPSGSPNEVRFDHNDHVSYFLNLSASEEEPGSILAGDRNLTRNNTPIRGRIVPDTKDVFDFTRSGHDGGAGNLLYGDGSVRQASRVSASRSFADAFAVGGTNPPPLLLIP
jgi:prepilin-type N-terminal cleavage/methylation domain-containing protein/prepilin-type processing-associated H-X9-DG protein